MRKRTQDDYIKTALRVPPDLHARIHEAAVVAGRTFNAELVARLEQSFVLPAVIDARERAVIEYLQAEQAYEARRGWVHAIAQQHEKAKEKGVRMTADQLADFDAYQAELVYMRRKLDVMRARLRPHIEAPDDDEKSD